LRLSTARQQRRGGRGGSALLAAPALLLYVGLVVAPLFLAFYYSLTDWDGASATVDFVGGDNYREAVVDDEVRQAFLVTAGMAVAGTAILNALALPAAVLLNRSGRVTALYRSAVFFPIVLSAIVVGFIWQTFLNTNGIVNDLLEPLGRGPILFLGEGSLAVASITMVAVWQTFGFLTVLYLAALKTVPDDIYEAARMDGARAPAVFFRITLPILWPAIVGNVLLILIFFMRIYEYVVAMTAGGPAGATQTVAFLVVKQAFTQTRYGYGSATAILLLVTVFATVLTISSLSSSLSRRRM
jgi:ABC-type sugar transport system permease subunit